MQMKYTNKNENERYIKKNYYKLALFLLYISIIITDLCNLDSR